MNNKNLKQDVQGEPIELEIFPDREPMMFNKLCIEDRVTGILPPGKYEFTFDGQYYVITKGLDDKEGKWAISQTSFKKLHDASKE